MDPSRPLKDEVIEQLPWLFDELGFRVVDDRYEAHHFGDSFVTLESDRLRVRLVRDRGEVDADVASLSEPDRWRPLVLVYEAISGELVLTAPQLDAVARFLRENLSALEESLGPRWRETKAELERRGAERIRAAREGLPDGPSR
jgi:hypothetical protein